MIFFTFFFNSFLTVVIETLFFMCFGYRSKKFIITCVFANIFTNLSLNLILYFFFLNNPNYYIYLCIFELIVIIIEATVYMIFNKKDYKLIPLTLSSNALSFLLGLLVYYILYTFFNFSPF